MFIAIVLFIAPAATFSLTNFLGGIGDDFHASTHFVPFVGGGGVVLGGTAGCLLFRLVDRLLPLRFLYLVVDVAGSLFTLLLIILPRSPTVFAVAFIGENVFQALAITTSIAITIETIGRRNPFAATIFCLLSSAFNIPITYMLIIDGWGYGKQGVTGSFAADSSLGVISSVLLGALLIWFTRRRPAAPMAETGTS